MRIALVVAALALTAGGCGSSEQPDPAPSRTPSVTTSAPTPAPSAPAQAVERLMRALDAGDCRAAKRLVVTPSQLTCDVVEQSAGSFADEGIDLDETTYRAGAVHDDSSTVRIVWGNDYPAESYDVQRVDGRWKVVFDSAA